MPYKDYLMFTAGYINVLNQCLIVIIIVIIIIIIITIIITIITIIINILILSIILVIIIIINIMIIHFSRWTELDINHLHACITITISACNILQNIFMSVGHNRQTAFDYLLCLKLTIHILTFLYFLFTVECYMFPRPRKTEPRF